MQNKTDRVHDPKRIFGNMIVYLVLVIVTIPILIGYTWLVIATFSHRTEGLLPQNVDGDIGGWTLQNWDFVTNPHIWQMTLNSFIIAISMVIGVGSTSSLAGYALSRMNFIGRRGFLSMTIVLHAFPSVTLLISIFFVLRFITKIPGIGLVLGYNTAGGIALVMISLDLPLGIWLMKGFFDNVSWDTELSALIDGA